MKNRILVVDDDQDIRETLVEVLEMYGYLAVGAADGAEALTRLREPGARWSVVLLDLAMPIMDGREFRTAQLDDPELAQIPVVLLSARHDVDAVAQELRVAGHVTKPVKVAHLVRLVEQLFRSDE